MNCFKITGYNFFIIISISFVINQGIPDLRYKQASALAGTKLYFFGGWFTTTTASPEVWYLDLSNSLNTTTLTWYNDATMPLGYIYGSACVSPIDNTTVYLIGGRMFNLNVQHFYYASEFSIFNSNASQSRAKWQYLNVNGNTNLFYKRDGMQAVFNNEKIFIYGGSNFSVDHPSLDQLFGDMNVLDTTTMLWLPLESSVYSSAAYTATLLPNGQIIYIGGLTNVSSGYAKMSEVQIFDTIFLNWFNKCVSGDSIGARLGHSAVLSHDKSIIIYGGSYGINNTQVFPDTAILNIKTWRWSTPNISQVNAPPPLTFHSATIYNNYMIIAFGLITNVENQTFSNKIYILDTQNYTWVTAISFNSSNLNRLSTENNFMRIEAYILIGIIVFIY
ncbi:galactose oxidase [Gigaspora margarita]|uniref:Galactose oxidase n=1 Tax=Gigaspora margarita TaxID=4874 RepID=A0A8H4ALY0_GIGMA|nr:galactose oxidase [Gigaspora margarita]